TPTGRKRPRRSCMSVTLRPRYSVSTAISALEIRSASSSIAELFSARARTRLLAIGTSLHDEYLDPQTHWQRGSVPLRAASAAFKPAHAGTGGLRLLGCDEVYDSELASANVGWRSSETPGPIVEARFTERMYCPLEPLGFARTTASTRTPRF